MLVKKILQQKSHQQYYHQGRKLLLLSGFVVSFWGIAALGNAQTTVKWLGKTNDAEDINNWDQTTSPNANTIVIGHADSYTYAPLFDAEGDFTFNSLNISAPVDETIDGVKVHHKGGAVIFDKPIGSKITLTGANVTSANYRLTIKSGNLDNTKANFTVENDSAHFVVTGNGQASFNNFLIGAKALTTGGKVTVEGNGVISIKTLIRFATNTLKSHLIIRENGRVELSGNVLESLVKVYVASGQINGGADYKPYAYYDLATNKTIIVAKPNNGVFVYHDDLAGDRLESLVAGIAGSNISALSTPLIANQAQGQWLYSTQSGGPYNLSFGQPSTTSAFAPVFDQSGTFFVVYESTSTEGVKTYSNELKYIVGSNKAVVTPAVEQYLRIGQQSLTLQVNESSAASSREWKWSSVSGGPYSSFAPTATETSYVPVFATPGVYYVVVESSINGVVERSKELVYHIQAVADAPITLTWNGSVDQNATDLLNWSPAGYINNNFVKIPASVTKSPVLTPNGTITILSDGKNGGSIIEAGAALTLKGAATDTLKLKGDAHFIAGAIVVESGVFVKDVNYLRFSTLTAKLTITGTGVAIFNGQLLLGNDVAPTAGGSVEVNGNGTIWYNVWPDRVPTSATLNFGKTAVYGNGRIWFKGDARIQVAKWVSTGHLFTADGYEISSAYDAASDWTLVTARDINGFAIQSTTTQYVGLKQLTDQLNLANNQSFTSFDWQYSKSPFGPWTSFANAGNASSANVSFNTSGEYYVTALADGATRTNNALLVKVFDVKASVATNESNDKQLSVTISEGLAKSEWKIRNNDGTYSQIESFGVTELTYIPNASEFASDGTYLLVFETFYTDELYVAHAIYSNPVTLVVANGTVSYVEEVATGVSIPKASTPVVYPNPSTGKFNIGFNQESYWVEVVDLTGKVVFKATSDELSNGSFTIGKKGIYLISIKYDDSVKVEKLVVR